MNVIKLKCEYLINPLGIDTACARLSYKLIDAGKNKSQSAYRILVATDEVILAKNTGDMWDTGKVLSSKTSQIEYAGKPLISSQKYYWKCMVWDENDVPSTYSDINFWVMGKLDVSEWKAKFIYHNEGISDTEIAHPVAFGKEIEIKAGVKSALLYSTSLGVYNIKINQENVLDNILAPEWTNYHKRVQYQTSDVTKLLKSGANEILADVSNGWYSGLWQMWPPKTQIYGKYPKFFMQLEVTYDSGNKEIFVTDETWMCTTKTPIVFSGIYEGETYDATIPTPQICNKKIWSEIETEDHTAILVAQRNEPIKITQVLTPINITTPKDGVYVIDFGQGFAGKIKARFHEKAGTLITIKHNEMLNKDNTVYMDNLVAGCFAQNVDRQLIRYTCKGDPTGEDYTPSFTYMGFRYIQIEGLTTPPSVNDYRAFVFHSSFDMVGEFSCSNEDINRLQQNIQWSTRSNMMGVPTDCPQRDERCGYTGDMQFFMPTAVMNVDMAGFMSKWLVDLCQDSQLEHGMYADHAPYFGMNGGNVGWGDAGVICPYICYKTYGDIENIKQHYNSMKKFTQEFLIATMNEDNTRGPECVGLGDWLSLGAGATKIVVGTAYLAHILFMMAEMAQVISQVMDAKYYRELYEKVKTSFISKFILSDGTIKESSLTGYALAVTMDLIPDDKYNLVANAFAKEIEKHGYKVATGFIGTPRLLIALNKIGRDDLAQRLLLQKECPSWLYPVTMGATTIWERWDGYTEENGFQDKCMNSFNHFAFGAVGDYLMRCIAGISQDESDVGYTHVVIKPTIMESMLFAKCSYNSINGIIKSEWSVTGDECELKVLIPVNTTATVIMPNKTTTCGSGEYLFKWMM